MYFFLNMLVLFNIIKKLSKDFHIIKLSFLILNTCKNLNDKDINQSFNILLNNN